MMRSLLLNTGRALVSLAVLLTAGWACLALWYRLPADPVWKAGAGVLWAGLGLATVALVWRGRAGTALLSYAVALALLGSWWNGILPSQNRHWADDVARQLAWRLDGSTVTLDNVRNFEWRGDGRDNQRWETRRYDLDTIDSVDVAVSYWAGPAIAHTLVSFGFEDGRHLAFSIEIRTERDEKFSSIGGFFKQFETSLIAADEHDILRVRTNLRGENVFLYRVRLPRGEMRSLFLAYLGEADALARQPRFYNTLTANCTTIVYQLARRIVPGLPMDWRLLASGYLPDYLHDVDGLTPGYDMKTLRARGRITDRAKAADGLRGADFSRAIRVGLPGEGTPPVPAP